MPGMLPGMLSANKNPFSAPAGAVFSRLVDLVVIHCAATSSGQSISLGERGKAGYRNAAQVIDGWHAQRGFKREAEAVRAFSTGLPHIGYHYVIDITGEVWSGRALEEIGAHALNFNSHSVGICMVGGAEPVGRFTAAQWNSLRDVVAMLLAQYGIPRALPRRIVGKSWRQGYTMVSGVCGHRDLSPDANGSGLIESFEWLKTCPGFDVGAWLQRGMRPDPKNIYEEKTA